MTPELRKRLRRVGAIAGAVTAIGGAAYAAASAVAKSTETERRVNVLEQLYARHSQDLGRVEGKLDALLTFFRIKE